MSTLSQSLARRHLRFGWYALLGFAVLGTGLEALHAFKIAFYLDVENETRRLMWRLAHAHGVGLGLVNLGFASTLRHVRSELRLERASACLIVASLLLPLGFLLGGIFATGGDPGLPIVLVPLALPPLFAALFWIARSL